jgi:hypothetical protein
MEWPLDCHWLNKSDSVTCSLESWSEPRLESLEIVRRGFRKFNKYRKLHGRYLPCVIQTFHTGSEPPRLQDAWADSLIGQGAIIQDF